MDNKDLSLLGKHSEFFRTPEEAKLEAFPNRSPQRRYVVTLDTHEFSSLCQPPDERMGEPVLGVGRNTATSSLFTDLISDAGA